MTRQAGQPGRAAPGRGVVAVTVLAAGTVAWAALPMNGASRGARPALIAAAGCAVLAVAQLIAGMLAARQRWPQRADVYVSPVIELLRRVWAACAAVPWPQALTVAVLVLEVLHRSRPWHTAVLGLALLCYLLALHLAESAAGPVVLRGQLPLIAAGLGLAGLSAGAAILPAAGAGSGWMTAIAAIAAVVVAALALPV